jgi:hypothetical protein
MSDSGWFATRRLLVVVLAGLLATGSQASAQRPNFDPRFDVAIDQPVGMPHVPPQGAWGEVINVTERWLVLQNHDGQQFPVAVEDIDEFLIRWPSNVGSISNQALVEAVGATPGSNVIRASHVDHFEGTDRRLVTPTYNEILPNNMAITAVDPGFNRFMNAWDYGGQNMLYGWAYPVMPGPGTGVSGNPTRLHVVGNLLNRDPLQIGLPGNNFATIVPDQANQMTVTQITQGSTRFVRKGDYAFLMPREAKARGLWVSQLVLYKTIPLRQFNNAAPR